MAKTLGAVTLPDQIEWVDRYDWAPVAQAVDRTLGGTLVLWTQPLSGGRPITLVASEHTAWLTQQQVDALVALAATAGQVLALNWEGEAHSVMFAHHAGDPIAFTPLWPHYSLFTGTLKLIEV